MTRQDVIAQVNRYLNRPGQVLAYTVGMLKIKELREQARKELGEKFDVRAFHDEVLGHGALPLDVLEEVIRAWVQRAGR